MKTSIKITKAEKRWVAFTALFYLLYNFPGTPPYGDAALTILHALLTVLPLWILAYGGMRKVFKIYRLRKDKEG